MYKLCALRLYRHIADLNTALYNASMHAHHDAGRRMMGLLKSYSYNGSMISATSTKASTHNVTVINTVKALFIVNQQDPPGA